ncbi:hypothetical protein OPQ81_008425 [Rhizoctonia solani]|nr:hypothetical protein OPQ81_008425 [Rhizoctonia solani]
MKVALSLLPTGSNIPSGAIFKLFGRRFANEDCYAEYLASGSTAKAEDDTVEFQEHLIAILTRYFFDNERSVDEGLSSLQGRLIPMFYGITKFSGDQTVLGLDITVPQVLAEFTAGTNLDQVGTCAVNPNPICTLALNTINTYKELGVPKVNIRLWTLYCQTN